MAVVHQIDEEAYGGIVFLQIFSDTLQGIIAMNDRNFLPVIIVCINGYGSETLCFETGVWKSYRGSRNQRLLFEKKEIIDRQDNVFPVVHILY